MIRSRSKSILRSESGVAAIEFALIVPGLLAVIIGGSELSRGIMNDRRVTLLARTVADLTSLGDATNQMSATATPMSAATLDDIFASAALVLKPFGSSLVEIKVSAIGIAMVGTTRTVKICSSRGFRTDARPVGNAPPDLVIPANYATNGMRLIVSEVSMKYEPMLGQTFGNIFKFSDGYFPLKETVIWPTRGGRPAPPSAVNEVILPGGAACRFDA